MINTPQQFASIVLSLKTFCTFTLCVSSDSQLQLAGVVTQWDQSPPGDATESHLLHPLQPAAAVPDLPVLVPRRLLQLQPAALLERRLPAGWGRIRALSSRWVSTAQLFTSLADSAGNTRLHGNNRNLTALLSVALNYQSEGRVLQLNRAKFYSNGNCGYILKPDCMCEGWQQKQSCSHFSAVQVVSVEKHQCNASFCNASYVKLISSLLHYYIVFYSFHFMMSNK